MKKMKLVEVAKSAFSGLSKENVQVILEMIKSEVADIKLTAESRKLAAKELNTDEKTAQGWQTVADIFKHVDTVELAKKYPDAAAATLKTALSIVGIFFGPAKTVACLLPEKVAAKIVEFSGIATPEHIVHEIAKSQAKKAKTAGTAMPEKESEES